MQDELGTENMVITNNPDTPTTKPLVQVKNPQLQRFCKILLIMLGICLGFWLAIAFVEIVDYTINSQTNIRIIGSMSLIALYGFGLFVNCKYSEKGLRVFAWMGAVIFGIGFVIILGILIVTGVDGLSTDMAIFFILFISFFIFTIIIVIIAFKLSRLIKENAVIAQI